VDICHSGLDVAPKLELVPTLVDFDRSQLACPFIDVLKQVAVDSPEMCEIECAAWHAASCPLDDETPLDSVQSLRIGNSKKVIKSAGARIDVGVLGCHFVASRAWRSM
jgi:hypothetical protein